jgi:HEPN domain-containing protein
MDHNLQEGRRWLAQARYDLQGAELNGRAGFGEIACFLAQQSAEKALKAYLYAQGERPVLGHATHLLVQRCAEYDAAFGELMEACRRLDQYYIPTRYPNGIPDGIPHDVYTAAQASEAAVLAQEVIARIEAWFAGQRDSE